MMTQTQLLVPKLRFKGFEGELDYERIWSYINKAWRKNKDGIKYPIYSISNKHWFILQSKQFKWIDSNDRWYDITLYKIVWKNTFAYNPARINVGSLWYSNELNDVIISSLYVCFTTNWSLDDSYLLQYFDTYNFNKSVLRNVEWWVREYLFFDNLSRIRIPIVDLNEQQKIASFLTSVDTKIQQLESLKSSREEYKKWVMQKIFSQEVRFKDENGKEFGEWEEKRLGEVFKFKQGVQMWVEKQMLDEREWYQRFIRIVDLTLGHTPPRYIVNPGEEHILSSSDLFMVRYWTPWLLWYWYEWVIANNLFRLIPISQLETDNMFYYYLLTFLNHRILSLTNTSTMPALNFTSLWRMKIIIPSYNEQQKISKTIEWLSLEIKNIESKIESAKQRKKWLLQQMFV